ncbi:MAG: MerR family transcriptional regulator [Bacteroidota bacterium]
MQIGEVAKRTGFSTDTLRYYEKLGLIHLSRQQRGENNYRQYDEDLVNRLLLIKQTKSLGFTLKEIKLLLELEEEELLECVSVGELMQAKLKAIEQQIQALQDIQNRLHALKDLCEGDCLSTMKQVAEG